MLLVGLFLDIPQNDTSHKMALGWKGKLTCPLCRGARSNVYLMVRVLFTGPLWPLRRCSACPFGIFLVGAVDPCSQHDLRSGDLVGV